MNNKRKITLLTLLALLGGLGNIEYAFSEEKTPAICKGNGARKAAGSTAAAPPPSAPAVTK